MKKTIAVCCLIMMVSVVGCASSRPVVLRFTENVYQHFDKYPIRIRVEMSGEYQRANVDMFGMFIVPLGPELVRHTNILAESIFELVADTKAGEPGSKIDAVLVAEVISIDHLTRMYAGQESRIAVVHKWSLKDTNGNPIWIQSVTGVGVMEAGTSFTGEERATERGLLAIDDLFVKSFEKMSASVEIKTFSDGIGR